MIKKLLNRILSDNNSKSILFLLVIDMLLIIILFLIKLPIRQNYDKSININFEIYKPEQEDKYDIDESLKTSENVFTHIGSNLDKKMELKEIRKNIKSLNKFNENIKDKNVDIFSDTFNIYDDKKQESYKELDIDEKNDKNIYSGKSTISYFLKNRYSKFLPNPVYKCKTKGLVYVDIYVDNRGYVKRVSINKEKTKINNECLFNTALEYSKRAKFNFDSKYSIQKGYIIYDFQ